MVWLTTQGAQVNKTEATGTDPSPGETAIVGVGASAGGLEAFSELLRNLPVKLGMAVVLVQHLEPTHESELAEILSRTTDMPVTEVEAGMRAEADHVYVIPPNAVMRMDGDAFTLAPRASGATPSYTVDIYLSSLAEQSQGRAIGVVLSGTGSDGTKGLAAIKAVGGITLAQDPSMAEHRGMPANAISAGVVDAALPVADIAHELAWLAEHPYLREASKWSEDLTPQFSEEDEHALDSITRRMRQTVGLDLTHYKRPTVVRRVERRMTVRRVRSLAEYASLLAEDADEPARLLSDVLVSVTSFFRDPTAFEGLKLHVFPLILGKTPRTTPIRIWVPGCSTGQEAYSIAMVLLECLDASNMDTPVQVFASDLREADLAFARRGVFPADIADEVGEDRLERFFIAVEGGYQISQRVRELCVFARHDVTTDPPFGHLDLVSCRNLLIYLDGSLQRVLLGTFHFALDPGGFLLLGESEGVSAAPGLFERSSEQKSLFKRLGGPTPSFAIRGHSFVGSATQRDEVESFTATNEREWKQVQRQLDDLLVSRYSPAAILVNDQLQVEQVRGSAGDYLRFRPGDATLDLGSMISPGFASAITSAIDEARSTLALARREAVQARSEGGHSTVDLIVIPMPSPEGPQHYAVLFNEGPAVSHAEGETGPEPSETQYLRQELEAATERLNLLRASRDMQSESLRAANEEIQSTNEELRSLNEELETAKEELQSTNEELITLNAELAARNAELTGQKDDLNNILSSAAIPILILDENLGVRRYTAPAADLFNLIPGDVGRKITDIRWRLKLEGVDRLLADVLAGTRRDERQVQDEDGRWYRMSTRPYLNDERELHGVVITLMDVDSLHRAAEG